MKISLNTLKYYVDINVPVEELCDKMVMAGFEVESIEKRAKTYKMLLLPVLKKSLPTKTATIYKFAK